MTHAPIPSLNDVLESILPETRRERLDQVLAYRLSGLTILLEDFHHPQNMGACIRTAEALGLTDVSVVDGLSSPFRPTHKVSRGGQKWLSIHRHDTVDLAFTDLEARGFQVFATSPDAALTLDEIDFKERTAICFGNELGGISEEAQARATATFRLPTHGFVQSLNVSVAVGIVLFHAAEARRRALGRTGDLEPAEIAALREKFVSRAVGTSTRIAEAMSREAKIRARSED